MWRSPRGGFAWKPSDEAPELGCGNGPLATGAHARASAWAPADAPHLIMRIIYACMTLRRNAIARDPRLAGPARI